MSKLVNTVDLMDWLTQGVIFTSEPGKMIIGWGEGTWDSSPDQDTSTWFYFPDFFLSDSHPWLHLKNTAILTIDELLSSLESIHENNFDKPFSSIYWENPNKEDFEKGFWDLQNLFKKNVLEKAVLYTLLKSLDQISPSHRTQIIINILRYVKENPAFAYGFWNNSEGMLGATPELLFRTQSTSPAILETMALAGTLKTSSMTPEQSLFQDKKLFQEHKIVVDDIVTRLDNFGKINLENLQWLELPTLAHLYTPIFVELKQKMDFLSFVKALFPTPALGGFPREFALKWLIEYNSLLPRRRFGAPVGFWDRKLNRKVCYVAIRNVQWNDTLFIGAGCGIIAESDLETEWQEILLKAHSVIGLLNLSNAPIPYDLMLL